MKKNRILAVLAALTLLCACTGCGSKTEEAKMKSDAAPEYEAAEEGYGIVADGKFSKRNAELAGDAVGGAADAAPEAFDGIMYEAAKADGREAFTPAPAADAVIDGEICIDPPVVEDPPAAPEIGVLTAGEWKDHENWGFFANLVNNGTISFPSFGVDPTQRIAVTVTDAGGNALPNAEVQLLDADHNPIWKAITDKNGIAYVFETNGRKGASVTAVNADGAVAPEAALEAVGGDTQSVNLVSDRQVSLTIEGSAVYYPDTQVMFIVDTTGSMGDEMFYLQSDFGSIAEEVGTDQTSYAVRFYRDEGDAYVTKTGSSFTTDPAQIRSVLNAESADGGGDEPEAVAEALSEAFSSDEWSGEAVKVAFLIYDAPPHAGKEDMIRASIEDAAAKGIRLIPVVSSNGSRETELFGRAAAICTGGSYVFLTDDSGVGGSHLEPIVGDYEVEKLHDIIVRIIKDMQQK